MKKTFRFNKLIRSKLYQRMLDHDIEVKLKDISSNKDLIKAFKEKILEEAEEVVSAESKDELIEELADCLEVIHGFAHVIGADFDSVEKVRVAKKEEKGGFYNSVVVDTVSLEPKERLKKFFDYYRKNPKKYPEVESQ
ncbi:MAG: hypothetical protein K0T99_02080 [Alphaproteobacteria bacterium]|nr:hypothetical protein [Alphaproteobacteria bacterium]